MHVLIVGAGSLGKCMAAFLTEKAFISMYERNPKTRLELKQGRFILQQENSIRKINIRSVDTLDKMRGVKLDVLIFATKVKDLSTAVAEAADLNPRYVLFPQNGIFGYRWAKRLFKKALICRGVTTMACKEIGHGRVRLFYQGQLYVGGDGAPFIADLFRKSGLKASAYRSPDGAVWAKLIFSSVMNPLPVWTNGYDALRKDKEVWRLVRRAVIEGKSTARALGIRLVFDPLRLIEMVRKGNLVGIRHRGSIVHDVKARQETELDFITGALIRQARRIGIKTSALDVILAKAKISGA